MIVVESLSQTGIPSADGTSHGQRIHTLAHSNFELYFNYETLM
jgi:hypothetical protein